MKQVQVKLTPAAAARDPKGQFSSIAHAFAQAQPDPKLLKAAAAVFAKYGLFKNENVADALAKIFAKSDFGYPNGIGEAPEIRAYGNMSQWSWPEVTDHYEGYGVNPYNHVSV